MKGSARGNFLIFLAIVFIFAAFFPQYSIRFFGDFLLVDQAPKRSNAIVVLLGAPQPDRVLRAAELYREGWAPRIVFGSGFIDRRLKRHSPKALDWVSPSTKYRRALTSMGIPSSAILVVDTSKAYDTGRELTAIAQYFRANDMARVILVTSATHTRRVDLIWHRVAPDIENFTLAAHHEGLDSWWRQGYLRRAIAYEYLALVKESWYQVLNIFQIAGRAF